MIINVQDVPPSLNKLLRMHWAKKKQLNEWWVFWVRTGLLPGPRLAERKKVTITLCHSRPYDTDNAHGAVKPVLDALRHWNLVWDDSNEWMDLEVKQEKCKHSQRHTIIEVTHA